MPDLVALFEKAPALIPIIIIIFIVVVVLVIRTGIPKKEDIRKEIEENFSTKDQWTNAMNEELKNVEKKTRVLMEDDVYVPKQIEFKGEAVPEAFMASKEAVKMGLSFRKKTNTIRITGYHGNEDELVIPSYIDGMRVNEIGQEAFRDDKKLKVVMIPSTLRKIGDRAFYGSIIEKCVIAPGLGYISSHCFAQCRSLSKVILPETLCSIESGAFMDCTSLKYIHFPAALYKTGNFAFSGSGLESFTITATSRIYNSLFFVNTPLQTKYKAVANTFSPVLSIILFNKTEKKFIFPSGADVFISDNALELLAKGAVFDFSACKKLTLSDKAFSRFIFAPGKKEPDCKIILPHGEPDDNYFPPNVEVKNADGSEYKQHKKLVHVFSGESCTDEELGDAKVIASFGIRGDSQKLDLKRNCTIEENAFICPELREIRFGRISANDCIFDNSCLMLHKVSWKEKGGSVVRYIPSGKVVSNAVHTELLASFRSVKDRNGKKTHFFDSSAAEKIFRKGIDTNVHGNVVHYDLSQKEKICIAIDVLRSTHRECDGDVSLYRDYLGNHRKYAAKVAKKYPDYDISKLDIR